MSIPQTVFTLDSNKALDRKKSVVDKKNFHSMKIANNRTNSVNSATKPKISEDKIAMVNDI